MLACPLPAASFLSSGRCGGWNRGKTGRGRAPGATKAYLLATWAVVGTLDRAVHQLPTLSPFPPGPLLLCAATAGVLATTAIDGGRPQKRKQPNV